MEPSSLRQRCRTTLTRGLPAVIVAGALLASGVTPAHAAPVASAPVSQESARAALAADPQLQIPGFDVDAFQNPTDQKPAVLWFWDRPQSEAEIDAKLESIKAAGFTETTIFRWFGDIPEAYFSQQWFDRVEHLLSKSRELGLTVWLDNDDKFPSGSAGGYIINGGTVGGKTYQPRPDLGVKMLSTAGSAVRDGGKDVELHDLFGASLQFEDGSVVADVAGAPGITLLKQGSQWQDYTVDATFSIVRATAGFMVRSADKQNGYLVDVRTDGFVDVWRQVNGNFTLLSKGTTSRADFDPTGSHDIQIALEGDRISVTLDGVAEPVVTDGSLPRGGVGMRVDGNQAWHLDDLQITALPGGEELYSNDFSDEASVTDFDVKTEVLENVVGITARPASGDGATDISKVIDITDEYLGDGTWSAPAGKWRLEAYHYKFRGGDRAAYADTMDVEAQELYNEIIFDEYYERFGEYFGTTLLGFADDEPEVGRHGDDVPPWSPAMADRLEAEGVSPAVAAAAVFNDFGDEGLTVRSQYYRAMSDQWVDAYWKTKYEWADDHGIGVLSNPLYDEYGPAGRLHETGNLLTMHQWAQLPGTDLIMDHVERGYVRNLPYEPASIAHQLGKPLVYDELMGAAGWHKSLADVRQGTAMSAVRGINKALFHATFDAPETAPFPPTFSENNVWWKFMPQLNDWTGRLMEFGRHTTSASTAVVQMQRAAEAAQRGDESAVDAPFFNAQRGLEGEQVDFDLLDEGALSADPQIIAQAEVRPDGTMQVGKMNYSALVVPSAPLVSLEAMDTLLEFAEAGGEIVFAGGAPAAELHGRNAELTEVLAQIAAAGGERVVTTATASEAGTAAAALGQSAIELSPASGNVRVLSFEQDGTAGFMILNEGQAAVTTDITFPAGVPVKWDPDTGEVAEFATYQADAESTTVPMTLLPNVPVGVTISAALDESAHVTDVVGSATAVDAASVSDGVTVTMRSDRAGVSVVNATDGDATFSGAVESPALPEAIALSGDWTMALANGSAPVTRPLSSWTDLAPNFSGDSVYSRQFELTAQQLKAQWSIDLGRVANAASIKVNGTEVGVRMNAPYVLDLGDVLVEGTNTLEITVTNTDGNSRGHVAESGLLGPVALTPYSLTETTLRTATVQIDESSAVMDASGTFATVSATVSNPTDAAIIGTLNATAEGWAAGTSHPVRIPAQGTATVKGITIPTGFIPDGDVPLAVTIVSEGRVIATGSTVLDASFSTPPGAFSDHVDLGDAASESAHALKASPTSGTNTEAGLTRRYAGYRIANAWYEFEMAVEPGKPFLLQGVETYDKNPQIKSYRIIIDGVTVATRLNARDMHLEGAVDYRLVVPAEFATSDRIVVRIQSHENPDFFDPSLADVWALPFEEYTAPVVAPTVTLEISNAGQNGWHTNGAQATIVGTGGSAEIDFVEYSLAGEVWEIYSGAFAVPEGSNTLRFRATDMTGVVSEIGSRQVKVDATAPTVSGSISDGEVTVIAADELSGAERVEYSLDGGATWLSGIGAALEAGLRSAAGGEQRAVAVQLRAVDAAGNVSASVSLGEGAERVELAPGTSIVVEASGFAAQERVRMEIVPGPIVLGETVANGAGAISASTRIPADLEEGEYSLVLVPLGVAGGGGGSDVEIPIDVIASTGADSTGWIALAALLLAAGGVLVIARRRHGKVAID